MEDFLKKNLFGEISGKMYRGISEGWLMYRIAG